jgi:hypothetical protein
LLPGSAPYLDRIALPILLTVATRPLMIVTAAAWAALSMAAIARHARSTHDEAMTRRPTRETGRSASDRPVSLPSRRSGQQAIWMHIAPIGAQMPQRALQQNSPDSQMAPPHDFGVSPQNSLVQPCPFGAHRLQLALQQYSPSPHVVFPHVFSLQSASEQATPCGTQRPPQLSQQTVPAMQRIVAHSDDGAATQSPRQLRSVIGSQPLAGGTHS